MHPCAFRGACCGKDSAVVGIKYVSDFWDAAALLDITFEVWPTCGDGLTLECIFVQQQTLTSVKLFTKTFSPSEARPHREQIVQTVPLTPGDMLMLLVDPLQNHDCDGVYVQDMKIWRSLTAHNV